MSSDPRLKILIIIFGVLIIGGVIAASVAYNYGGKQGDQGVPELVADLSRYDFGDIPIDGGLVSHSFEIKNEGTGSLKISGMDTSCMCTVAVLEVNGNRSPEFGMAGHGVNPAFWSEEIAPGQTAKVKATFDPMAHGPNAIGAVTRTVTVYSNDGNNKNARANFVFTANVVR